MKNENIILGVLAVTIIGMGIYIYNKGKDTSTSSTKGKTQDEIDINNLIAKIDKAK